MEKELEAQIYETVRQGTNVPRLFVLLVRNEYVLLSLADVQNLFDGLKLMKID